MQERFRVALGNFRKLVTVTHGVTTLENLHSDIHFAFSKCPIYRNAEFILQYFDEQFNEFIDLDDVNELNLLIDKRLQVVYMDDMFEVTKSGPITSSVAEGHNECGGTASDISSIIAGNDGSVTAMNERESSQSGSDSSTQNCLDETIQDIK